MREIEETKVMPGSLNYSSALTEPLMFETKEMGIQNTLMLGHNSTLLDLVHRL